MLTVTSQGSVKGLISQSIVRRREKKKKKKKRRRQLNAAIAEEKQNVTAN